MKVNKLFLGLFVCTAFCACSNDDPEVISENVTTTEAPKVFTGDEAYICIRLADAGSLKRATDAGYEYGEADEQKVENAYFYFYDANGNFVSQGSAWNDGTANDKDPVENIEFNANTVAVLKGLTEKNYPKYMVTVLNRPENFVYGMTLDEMEKKLSTGEASGITDGKNFVMSTTSYKHTNGIRYFVTEVEEKHFLKEPVNLELADDNYVTVYVERLAAKVTLKTDLANTMVNGMYEITASVAGENNNNGITSGNNQMAVEKLYVKLLGWTLNATAKESYIVKNINESWADQFGNFTWNKASDYRSFWGKSTCYGKENGYPTDAATYDDDDPYNLNYVNLANPNGKVGGSLYCAENTNTSAVVTANFPSAVTSILLKAEVCDKDGKGLDLVRFNGLLFNNERFLDYILNVVKGKGDLNAWVKTSAEGATEDTYEQIDATYTELVDVADGEVKVALNKKAENATLYTRGAYNEETKKYTFTEGVDRDKIDEKLAEESADAVGYKGGLMYYNIPIEHLNNADVVNGVTPEAKYGIVRNHHYVVTINKLEHVGQGIFDPDEVIVPGDGRDDEYYYVGANINILSWKLVNQTVGL